MSGKPVNPRPALRCAWAATVLALLGLALATPGVLAAQDQGQQSSNWMQSRRTQLRGTASMSGLVADVTGRTIPNVAVVLVDRQTGVRHQAMTDASGRYTLNWLPAGDYRVEVRKPGFHADVGRLLLADGEPLQRDILVKVDPVRERVVVSAKRGERPEESGPPVPHRVADTLPGDPCAKSAVGGCLTLPSKVIDATPVYPAELAAGGVTGKVIVDAWIGKDGLLKNLSPRGGADPALVAAAVEAVRLWEFVPLRLDGKLQECEVEIVVEFRLERD
jgi:TonB family protein